MCFLGVSFFVCESTLQEGDTFKKPENKPAADPSENKASFIFFTVLILVQDACPDQADA